MIISVFVTLEHLKIHIYYLHNYIVHLARVITYNQQNGPLVWKIISCEISTLLLSNFANFYPL